MVLVVGKSRGEGSDGEGSNRGERQAEGKGEEGV